MKKAFLLIAILACASAIGRLEPANCPSLGAYMDAGSIASCAQIDGSLTTAEKKEAVASLMYDNTGYPDYQFVRKWNTDTAFLEPPDGVALQSSMYGGGGIKDAWMRIMTVTPTAYDEASGRLLAAPDGEVQTGYNYGVQIPPNVPGVHACAYLEQHFLDQNDATLEVSLNGNTLESGLVESLTAQCEDLTMVQYSTADKILSFQSELGIDVLVRKERYHEYQYCCQVCCSKEGGCSCCRYCWACAYDGPEMMPYTLTLTDNFNAELHNFGYHLHYAMDRSNRAKVVLFSLEPLNAFNLRFWDAYYHKSNYDYGLTSTYAPYDILSFIATPYQKAGGYHMDIRESTVDVAPEDVEAFMLRYGQTDEGMDLVQNARKFGYAIHRTDLSITVDPAELQGIEKCSMTLASHFRRISMDDVCSKSVLPQTELSITVPNESYERGDEIIVEIALKSGVSPLSGEVMLSFQGEERPIGVVNGAAQAIFTANEGGVITASYAGDLAYASQDTQKKLFVSNWQAWYDALYIVSFFLGWYVVFIALKSVSKRWSQWLY